DAALLARAATVVRNRRHVADRSDHEAGGLQSAQGGFTTGTGAADFDFKRLHAVFLGLLGAVLGSDLGGERGRLARTLEALGTSGRPGNRVALCVGDGDHRVVEAG